MTKTAQILIGITALVTGSLVYFTDRPGESVMFISHFVPEASLYQKIPPLFGLFGQSLPGFAHTFSFSLITAVFFKYSKMTCINICLFWFTINCLFESGQKYSSIVIKLSPASPLNSFFTNGTFDPFDILAFAAGSLTAYALLVTTEKKESTV